MCESEAVTDQLVTSFNCSLRAEDINCTDISLRDEGQAFRQMPLFKCLDKAFIDLINDYIVHSDEYMVPRYCRETCSENQDFTKGGWDQYCDHVYLGRTSPTTHSLDYVFNCKPKPFEAEALHISSLCDGRKDCSDGSDEKDCPDRFYCAPNASIESFPLEKMCDKVKDCSNGQDECGTCDMGPLSSSEYLIHNKVVMFVTCLVGILMIVLNLKVGYDGFKSEPSSNAGKVDRILRLQVCFYDGSMGLYNLSIVIAALVLRGKGHYCLFDQLWRSGVICSSLGVLFSVSSHGSLMIIALMSLIRCLVCTQAIEEVRKAVIIAISAVLFLLNLVNSIVPVLPVASIQDIFRTQAFFTNFKENPFISSGLVDVDRLNELHEQYFSTRTDFYSTIKNLNNMTSEEGLFDVLEIGYYGNNRMCTHNVFQRQDSFLFYQVTYFILVFLILLLVAVTYFIILCKKVRSHRRLKQMGAGEDRAKEDEISSLKVKIFLMIGTQLLSWISFIIVAACYQFLQEDPPSMTFEVFALIVIPANSVLNPVFYSGLYTTLRVFSWGVWRGFVEMLRSVFAAWEAQVHDMELSAAGRADDDEQSLACEGHQEE